MQLRKHFKTNSKQTSAQTQHDTIKGWLPPHVYRMQLFGLSIACSTVSLQNTSQAALWDTKIHHMQHCESPKYITCSTMRHIDPSHVAFWSKKSIACSTVSLLWHSLVHRMFLVSLTYSSSEDLCISYWDEADNQSNKAKVTAEFATSILQSRWQCIENTYTIA